MIKKPRMLVFVLTLIMLGILILSAKMMVVESQVNWLYNYDEGLSKARTENKIVLLYFHADWCSWCKKLNQETFSNQSIASYLNEKLILIKIDVEKNISLSETYEVYDIPTVVFLSVNGTEVGRQGYLPPGQFLKYVRNIVKQYD